MGKQSDPLREYRTKNLLLLMGTNPLPNYVAAKLLCCEHTRLHLVITPETGREYCASPEPIRQPIHKRLIKLLGGNPNDELQYIHVHSIDPNAIFQKVHARVLETDGSWGLHYTGGKKVMAIHADRAMEAAIEKKRTTNKSEPAGVYSYLDAATRQLIIDPRDMQPSASLPFILSEPVTLWQLLELHGQPQRKVEEIKTFAEGDRKTLAASLHRTPFKPKAATALTIAWLTHLSEMKQWVADNLDFDSSRFLRELYKSPIDNRNDLSAFLRDALRFTTCIDPTEQDSKNKTKRWVKKNKLARTVDVKLPDFVGADLGGKSIGELAETWGEKQGHIVNWLHGIWLEHYVLAQLEKIKAACCINDYLLGLESNIWQVDNPKADVFESDVLVMQGHRLHYISVTRDDTKKLCKSKLFEAHVRAQQLGGEHAKAALVAFYKHPAKVENEFYDERLAKVKVFGPGELRDPAIFQAALKTWFNQS